MQDGGVVNLRQNRHGKLWLQTSPWGIAKQLEVERLPGPKKKICILGTTIPCVKECGGHTSRVRSRDHLSASRATKWGGPFFAQPTWQDAANSPCPGILQEQPEAGSLLMRKYTDVCSGNSFWEQRAFGSKDWAGASIECVMNTNKEGAEPC